MIRRLSLSEDLSIQRSIDADLAALDRLPSSLDQDGYAIMCHLDHLMTYRAGALVHDDRSACRQWLWRWDAAGIRLRPMRFTAPLSYPSHGPAGDAIIL